MEKDIRFWGTLDVAARTLESIPEPFQALYDRQDYRMRPDDVIRMEKYLRRIVKATKGTKKVMKLFKQLNTK